MTPVTLLRKMINAATIRYYNMYRYHESLNNLTWLMCTFVRNEKGFLCVL